MDAYAVDLLPFRQRRLTDTWLAISSTGDHLFMDAEQLDALRSGRIAALPLALQARLRSHFFAISKQAVGSRHLLKSRHRARRETLDSGPALHIFVPTLQCAHSCQYCQVSRALDDTSHVMSHADLVAACETVFQSDAQNLTIEFQGGDPLLRFDMVKEAVSLLKEMNRSQGRNLRFVVASTLHQLDEAMCVYFAQEGVKLSTSVDGPAWLHNRNRPVPGRNAYERTVEGIAMARRIMGEDAVSALMTTTRTSLRHPEEIVDEYVRLGFDEIFLRPLSVYGFAKRNIGLLGYKRQEFESFYERALERVLYWNRRGVPMREVYASVVLNKILSPFDAGYVDLQSPTGYGQAVVVYNYDGYVYPGDEARMLAEVGDTSLRLGRIGELLDTLRSSPVQHSLIDASTVERNPACRDCAYQTFCAPNPIDSQAQFGRVDAPVLETEHCQRHQWLFDYFFGRVRDADAALMSLFHAWARHQPDPQELSCEV